LNAKLVEGGVKGVFQLVTMNLNNERKARRPSKRHKEVQ
jgi:hypothetical protein